MRRAVLLALLVLTAACTRETPDVSQNAPSRSSESPAANPQAGTGQDTALNPTVPINTDSPTSRVPAAVSASQNVQLLEYEIRMPETLAAGVHRMNVTNAGKEKHGLAIEGMDVKANDIAPGASSAFDLTLPAGTYTVYCPVEGHRGKGMERMLTVK
jgi:plastocyanin